MFAQILGETTCGIDGVQILVEVDVSNGLPSFDLVGLPAMAVRESKERVKAAQNVMERYFNMLNLSARSHDRILKVARTIADLAGSENIEAVHLAEAIQLRTSVRP